IPPDSKAVTSCLPGWSPPTYTAVDISLTQRHSLKALHTPVPLVCWLLSNSGPRIGDFIPPKSLRNLQAQVPKQALQIKEETHKPVSSALRELPGAPQ
ncbi:unnamed protein product, partial [Staurois parvus]